MSTNAWLRMPRALIRELVSYSMVSGGIGPRTDNLLRTIVSVVCELSVKTVHVDESPHRRTRTARIVIAAQDADQFASLFPDAARLRDPAPELVAFRISTIRRAS